MRDQQRNEIKVGITVLVGLAVLVIGFAVFKEWSLGSSQYIVHLRFPSSAGLQTGDQVFVNGVKAGKVESVTLDGTSVLVDAYVDNEVVLTSDARARIQMLELMGGKKVEITQGSSRVPVARNEILRGTVDPDIAGALGMAGGLEGKVKEISTNANALLTNANNILGDKEFVAAIKEAVSNLRDASRELKPMIAENRGNVKELSTMLVGLAKRADTLVRVMSPKLNRGLASASALMQNTDTLVTTIRTLVADIRTNKSLVSRLMNDSTLSTRMGGLLQKLDSLSNLIIEGNFKAKIRIF